jgi:predicted ATPase
VSQTEATELLGSLVSKSLVQFSMQGREGAYRVLDMTRGYAFEKLRQADEVREIADRHARLIRRVLEDAATGSAGEGLRRPIDLVDDMRAALEWSLSEEGDLDTGAALAAASAPIWLQAGLLMECRFWMTRALESIDAAALGAHRQLSIQAALASAENFTNGFTDDSFNSWLKTFDIAKSVANIEQQLTCLIVLWAHRIRSPDYQEAFSLARQADDLAIALSDPGTRALADWITGITHHHRGELAPARLYLERSLAGDTLQARQGMITQFGYDRRVPSLGVLSNLCWLEGRADEAPRLGATAIAEARGLTYPVPLCEALTWQALNLHLRGDDPDRIEALLDEAVAHARCYYIESYVGLALALRGLNTVVKGDLAGAAQVGEGLDLLSRSHYEVFHPLFRSELMRFQAQAGMHLRDEDVGALRQLVAKEPEGWTSAEVKRNLGEILLPRGEADRAARLFADAIDCAERQGALAWALRASLSLARSATDEGSRLAAMRALDQRRQRFTEGEATADLEAANLFLTNGSHGRVVLRESDPDQGHTATATLKFRPAHGRARRG